MASLEIVCKNCNKFLGRERPGVGITGNMAKMFSVALRPVSVQKRSYAVLDGIRGNMKIFRRITIKRFAGKKRAGVIRSSLTDDISQIGKAPIGRIGTNPDE